MVEIGLAARYGSRRQSRKEGSVKRGGTLRRVMVALGALIVAVGLPAGASAGATRHALLTEVHVTFTDKTLLVRASNPNPGPATIFIVNRGAKLHVLTIRGPGMRNPKTQRVAPGAKLTVGVKLLAGAYQITDPVGLGKSMVRWLVVHPSNLVPATTTITPPKQSPTNAVVPGGMDCDL
jgi:hypothetical protein